MIEFLQSLSPTSLMLLIGLVFTAVGLGRKGIGYIGLIILYAGFIK